MENKTMEPINAEIVNDPQQGGNSSAVAIRNNNTAMMAAPLTVKDIVAQVKLIQDVMREVMTEGEHYGKIPGCGDKKALLQPGAQKLCMTFRLVPEYTIQEVDLPKEHKEYRIICTLKSIGSGTPVGQGVGACSSMESKYRYRGGARKCPECGKESIIKGKAEYGGGWLCWANKGGCGHKWPDGAQEIESQPIGKIENENPADTFNTVLKMAKKRAFVDATITATAASDIFTQDVGDPETEEGQEGVGHPQSNPPATQGKGASKTTQAASKPAASSKPAQPAKAPPAQSQPAKTQDLAALREKWKVYFLGQVKKHDSARFAYAVCAEKGLIIPGVDKLEDISAHKLPQTQTDFGVFWQQVMNRKARATDEGGMPKEETEAYEKAYMELPLSSEEPPGEPPAKEPAAPPNRARSVPPPEKAPINVPRDTNDPNSPDAPWRSFPMPWGKHSGTQLAALDKKYLFGLWANFEVETEYNGKPKAPANIAKDRAFRAALDEAGKHYEFEKPDDKKEERDFAQTPAGDMPAPGDDDVPF